MEIEKILQKHTTRNILVDGYEIDTVRMFLDFLGKPDKELTVFHIGGTSGKGSTSTLLASIMSGHGMKTGLFLSPHIETIRERIQIDNELIEEEALQRYVKKVLVEFEEFIKSTNEKSIRKLTYFEILFVVALLYFRDEGVKHAVIEVGIGGKLDPTNTLFGKYCILTNVGLDHQKYLGDSVEEIAKDKVQIVKTGATLVTGVSQDSVKKIVDPWAVEVGAGALQLSKEFAVGGVEVSLTGTKFDYRFGSQEYMGLKTNLIGKHQATNASLAISAFLRFAKDFGVSSDFDSINNAKRYHYFLVSTCSFSSYCINFPFGCLGSIT